MTRNTRQECTNDVDKEELYKLEVEKANWTLHKAYWFNAYKKTTWNGKNTNIEETEVNKNYFKQRLSCKA